ncbi:MAG: phospholipase D-like domain-containing protein [Elusimicrobia bacterium]|nr:phospholipase D-like domain-containing protein [Elusimicrobiota bacterium]
MTTGLMALCMTLLNTGWAANVQTVQVGAPTGINAVIPTLAAPAANLQLNALTPQAGLTGTLHDPGAAPVVRAQLAPSVLPALPILPAPAVPSLSVAPQAAAPQAAAPDSPAENPGRTALERLGQDLHEQQPAAGDVQGAKSFADRSFEYKLGGPSVEAAAEVSAEAAGEAEVEQAGSGSIGHRKRKGKEEPNPNVDDGGGAKYPTREVKFNGHSFATPAFRPNVPVEEKIVEAINASKTSIKLALYEFKLRGVLAALQDAKKRGVKIEIILDYSNVFPTSEPDSDYHPRRSPEIWGLLREGFEVNVLRGVTQYGINHNKFAVFDGKMLEFGSFNWSFTAEHAHYENADFSVEPDRIQAFSTYYDYLKSISVPFAQARNHDWPKTVPAPPLDSGPGVSFNGVKLPSFIFMPNGSAFEDAVVKAIGAAKDSVDVAQFAIRSTRIAEALARARARGLNVRVIFDESQSESEYFGPYAAWLASQGVEVRTLSGPDPDSAYPMAEKMHNKFMVLDGKFVETGSANWTKRASMDNYENAHFLADPTDAAAFAFAFGHMFSVARPYPKPGQVPALPTDADLVKDIENPPARPDAPPAPELPPLPAARAIPFNGTTLPSFALLPYQPIEPLYVKAIDAAKKSLQIAIYEFTSQPILEALRRAKARGVKIDIILDRNHLYTTGIGHTGEPRKPKPEVVALAKEFHLKTLKGKSSGVMHNKFLVMDDALVSFGSYNLTDVAEKHHFENLMFSDDAKRVANYGRYFDYMQGLAQEVDQDKLDEILNRTIENMSEAAKAGSDDSEEPAPEAAAETTGRGHQIPPPPEDPEKPIKFNGVDFPRQLFSPQGHIEAALVQAVKAAKVSIDIAMFSFYSQAIADALLEMKKAHPELKIRIILDYSQSKLAELDDWFVSHGFEVRLLSGPAGDEGDPMFQKMHNKLIIVDHKLLETGSFNYSPNAENNSFENANFTDDPTDLAGYVAYYERLWLQGWKASPPKRKAAAKPAVASAQRSHGSESEPLWSDSQTAPALAGAAETD